MNFKTWLMTEQNTRLASDFIKEFKNQAVQVHILKALMSHEFYRGHSAVDILNMEIPSYLERDVQIHLGIKHD